MEWDLVLLYLDYAYTFCCLRSTVSLGTHAMCAMHAWHWMGNLCQTASQ